MSTKKILVGADPELFLAKNGQFVSAHNLLPGTKYEPFPVKSGAIQVDGMAAEFNIDPVENEDSFLSSLETVLTQLKSMVPDYDFCKPPSTLKRL